MYAMILAFIFSLSTSLFASSIDITMTPEWKDLDSDSHFAHCFDSTWMLTGIITIKKHIKEPLQLNGLTFKWRGPNLPNLHASLYKKNRDQELMAIEKNHISDSEWQPSQQRLLFHFPTPLSLNAVTLICLVLTIPHSIDAASLQQGSFVIESSSLGSLQDYIPDTPITLAWHS